MTDIDITQSLKDTENSLRDFIASILEKVDGPEWWKCCGISPDRLSKWEERRDAEMKRQSGGVVEPRLIYYADFYDLQTILRKKWEHFKDVFDDQTRLRVYLDDLEKLRDPDAHRRELVPHQKHLIVGIGGELRSRIIQHRNRAEDLEAYFPRIESVRDSLGNVWIPDRYATRMFHTKQRLRPGDMLDFVITASDPLGAELLYGCNIRHARQTAWQKSHQFSIRVREEDVGRFYGVSLQIKSPRLYHAHPLFDDNIEFIYSVLPPRVA